MADDPHTLRAEGPSSESNSSPGYNPSPSAGAFIANSRNFTISGGNFMNVVNNAPVVVYDFRTIPLGDVDLRNEIRLEHSRVVNRQRRLHPMRRVYTARIQGMPSDMTVAVYQGENAQETWKQELAKYSGLRHPNIVQLYGAVNSGGLYATIFLDDLIPFEHFMDEHRHSVISLVYLYTFFSTELEDADEYFQSRFRTQPDQLHEESISWIRGSTGRLCVEIAPDLPDDALPYLVVESPTRPRIPLSFLGPDPEINIISSLTLNQFHRICYWYLSTPDHIYMLDNIHLGAIISRSGENIREIAYIPNVNFSNDGWTGSWIDDAQITPTHMEHGWSRFHSSSAKGVIRRTIWRETDWGCWHSQANHVFSQLAFPPKHEDCLLINAIYYQLSFSGPSENLPEGYLFLCLLEDLQDNEGRWLPNPECPAYWSLDPSGSQRLSAEEAFSLGFPSLEFEMKVWGRSWNGSVYVALSRFHAAKAFDPNSQEVALHLGLPLYEISCSPGVDSARFEEVTSEVCEDRGHCFILCALQGLERSCGL